MAEHGVEKALGTRDDDNVGLGHRHRAQQGVLAEVGVGDGQPAAPLLDRLTSKHR